MIVPSLIDYIVLSEFDINAGSIVRCQYPQAIPGVETGIIASYMLPEGAHNRVSDTTYFSLNRLSSKTQSDKSELAPQIYLANKFFSQERIDGLRALALKPKMIFQA